jgi:DNA-binding transcriptional regulator YhcF (GntR family)
LEFKNNSPIYLQVIDDLKRRIVIGEILLGEKMPSTRELALQYQINPNTAVRVYNEMEGLGLVFTKRGLGTFVTEDVGKYNSIRREMAEDYVKHFMEGMSYIGFSKEEIIKCIEEFQML